MADLTTAGVTVNRLASTTRSNGLVFYEKHVTMTLAANGTMTAGQLIPASAFGLSSIEEITPLVKSDDTEIVPAGPSTSRANLLAKAAGTAAPAALTGVYSCVVKGY